jgi:hypothetical protein
MEKDIYYLSLFSPDKTCVVKRVKIEVNLFEKKLNKIMKEFRNDQVKNVTGNKKESPKNWLVICETDYNNHISYFAHFPEERDLNDNLISSGYHTSLKHQLEY